MSRFMRFRFWLIHCLAGKHLVVVNATIYGTLSVPGDVPCLISGSTFWSDPADNPYPHTAVALIFLTFVKSWSPNQ